MQDAPYRTIQLRNRAGETVAVTKVSPEDYEWLCQRRWYLNGSATAGYAVSTEHKRMVLMSREILGLRRGDKREADHENRDHLDNRRSNLRVLTRAENAVNKGSYRGSTSSFRGVCWHATHGKWQAQAKLRKVKHYLGMFVDEAEAARAVNAFWVARGYPAPNDV